MNSAGINKIVVIIPYFGQKPVWFDFFLKSCEFNPQIDWLIFTDCLFLKHSISNIRVFSMTLNEFNKLASEKLNADIQITNPYKLCDLKPAYALIFNDYIKKYSFWAYGDTDLIYGDICSLLPEEFDKYEIISMHNSFVPGHFCLLKKNEKIIKLFQLSTNWEKIFQESNYQGFDEHLLKIGIYSNKLVHQISKNLRLRVHLVLSKLNEKYKGNKLRENRIKEIKEKKKLKDFNSIVNYLIDVDQLKIHYSLKYSCEVMLSKKKINDWEFIWENGKLKDSQTNNEYIYFHFQLSKSRNNFIVDKIKENVQVFTVSRSGIKCIR